MASTPSSYIPTNGSTVTRASETLTAPSANLPWWTDNIVYTSDELVTNGTFDSDVSGWSAARGNSTLSVNSGSLRATADASGAFGTSAEISGLTVGAVYFVSIQDTGYTASFSSKRVAGDAGLSSGIVVETTDLENGTAFVATATTMYVGAVGVASSSGEYLQIDNISVREIETPAISIAMEGTMTYADTGSNTEVYLLGWDADPSNRISIYVQTDGAKTGRPAFQQYENGTFDAVLGADDAYSPGINVPFSIASRHGATFINGAVDGTALTENTTPTALPDLSSTDLDIAPNFMGTIRSLRIWADDIGDDGLEEASS